MTTLTAERPSSWGQRGIQRLLGSDKRGAAEIAVPEVTIVELAKLYADLTGDANPDHNLSQAQRVEFQRRLAQFADHNGKIRSYFFCSSLPAGAVYTAPPTEQLHLTFPPDAVAPTWIAEQLMRSQALYIEIREILRSRDRAICMELIFELTVQLLRLMGNEDWRQKAQAATGMGGHRAEHNRQVSNATHSNQASAASEFAQELPTTWAAKLWTDLERIYTNQISESWAIVQRAAQRQAQFIYFLGMITGVLLLASIGLLGRSALSEWCDSMGLAAHFPYLVSVPVAGALGATISVMQRMSTGDCALRYRAGRRVLFLVGAFRPFIGATFAGAIVLLTVAGMLPFERTTHSLLALYVALAFLAGFSERWAQDMLTTGKTQLPPGDPERRIRAT